LLASSRTSQSCSSVRKPRSIRTCPSLRRPPLAPPPLTTFLGGPPLPSGLGAGLPSAFAAGLPSPLPSGFGGALPSTLPSAVDGGDPLPPPRLHPLPLHPRCRLRIPHRLRIRLHPRPEGRARPGQFCGPARPDDWSSGALLPFPPRRPSTA